MSKQHKIEKPDDLLKRKVPLFEFRLSRDKLIANLKKIYVRLTWSVNRLNLILSMNILLVKFFSQFFALRSSCFSLAVLLCFLASNILYGI